MKSVLGVQLGVDRGAMQKRMQAVTQIRAHGTHRVPAAPRGLQTQPAEGGVLLTWNLPTRYQDVTGYRVYVGSESNLAMQVKDRGTRQMFVPLQTAATAPHSNVFVSVVNGFKEGPKVQIQAQPHPNANFAGPRPQPSADYLDQFSGGLDKTQSGQPSGARTP